MKTLSRTIPSMTLRLVILSLAIAGGALLPTSAARAAPDATGPYLDVLFAFEDLRNPPRAHTKVEAMAIPHAVRVTERLARERLSAAGREITFRYHRDATVLDLHRAILDPESLGVIWFSHGTAAMIGGEDAPLFSRIPDLRHADASPYFRLPEAREKYLAIVSCNAAFILPELDRAHFPDGSKFLAGGKVMSPRRGIEEVLPHLQAWLSSASARSAPSAGPAADRVILRIVRKKLVNATELVPVQVLSRGRPIGVLDSSPEQTIAVSASRLGPLTMESSVRDLRPFVKGQLEIGAFEITTQDAPEGFAAPSWRMFSDSDTGKPFGVLERVLEIVR